MDLSSLSPEGCETYIRYCMRSDDSVRLQNVILSPENQKKVGNFMEEQQNAAKLKEIGFEPINRILMYGATGTGKTYLSQAIANELKLPMLHIDISKLKAAEMAAIVTDMFNLADEFGSAVIFFDECDSICWAWDADDNEDSAAVRRANNVLFQQLDQMSGSHVFISATNLYSKLDAAFKRRFNIEMKFLMPKISDFSSAVFKFLNPRFEYVQDMEQAVKAIVDDQARGYSRMSYYQIKDWVHRAEKTAVLADKKVVLESAIYGMLMQAMRIEVKKDKDGGLYLHQYGVQSR